MATLPELLQTMVQMQGSDLHITTNTPPQVRVHGKLQRLEGTELTPAETKQLSYSVLTDAQKKRFEETLELDFSFGLKGLARFRCNMFNQRGSVGAVYRVIPEQIRGFQELALPPVIATLADRPRGLVLVTGPTGSGKSTTLAAMIDFLNKNSASHIDTIEDPIEFLHSNQKSIVNQREVGLDTLSYHRALRSAMREAPDVILIGEIRDRETMQAAIDHAGTGHLAIATLHANNSPETLDRIINMYPNDQHKQVLMDLSQYVRVIISQRLVRSKEGRRVAAVEVMLNTPHISELILKGDISNVKEAFKDTKEPGMQSFDQALFEHYRKGAISMEEALSNADSRANLEAKINFG